MRKVLYSACILSMFVWACKNNSSNPVSSTPPPPNYYPLAIGNVWHYSGYYTDATGTKIPGTDQTETDTVTGTAVIGGANAFEVTEIFKSSILNSRGTNYLFIDQNGNLQTFVDTVRADTALVTGHDTIPAEHGYWSINAWFNDTSTTIHHYPPQPTIMFMNIGGKMDTLYGTSTRVQLFGGDSTISDSAGTFATHVYRDSIQNMFSSPQFGSINGIQIGNSFYAINVGEVLVTEKSTYTGALQNSSGYIRQLVSSQLVHVVQ